MDFMNALANENSNRKALTENGAVAYATTGKEILDFNFKLTGYRNASIDRIKRDFGRVYYENPTNAIRFLFWVGDIREGAGERKVFQAGLTWLAEKHPEVAKALIPFVGMYNRFDSLRLLLDTSIRNDVSVYLKKQIQTDAKNAMIHHPITLCAKWMPSINASSKVTRKYAKMLCEDFGWSYATYRKTLSTLRKYINIVEFKMSNKQWSQIDYATVPSKANLIYNNAFLRNDEERRREYLASLKKGDTKINAGVLQPHEIVTQYNKPSWWASVKDYDETLEQLWKNLPNMTIENTLVVHDSSGSMTSKISGRTSCLDVATALAVFMSEHNTGGWKDKFVTFSSEPKIVDMTNLHSLHDKLDYISEMNDYSNTDIYRTMQLILRTAVKNRIPQNEMPGLICICSDMQFDGRMFNFNSTLFEDISKQYESVGYKMPKICFWNINDRGEKSIPLKQNDYGLILCSGFSVQIMKMFMSNKLDPYEILLETINAPRYDAVANAVSGII